MQTYYFLQEMKVLIDGMRDKSILTLDGDYYAHSTIREWKNKMSTFKEYIIDDIPLSKINYDWYEEYRLYLLNKGYAKNSISVILSVLKAFIRRMHIKGKMKYNGTGIRTGSEITTAVFTTTDEIKKMLDLDLSDTPGFERIRDIYVCQCFLGLRVSDMKKFLSKAHLYLKTINGKRFFEVPTNKTGEIVAIPASKIVMDICTRRNFDFGKSLTQQQYHRDIRVVVKKAAIDREIIFKRTEGGAKIERGIMFSSKVGTHTARRTFATNAYLAGVPVLDIMKITGHRSFNSFYRYIRCENTAVALRLADHEFFNLDL